MGTGHQERFRHGPSVNLGSKGLGCLQLAQVTCPNSRRELREEGLLTPQDTKGGTKRRYSSLPWAQGPQWRLGRFLDPSSRKE